MAAIFGIVQNDERKILRDKIFQVGESDFETLALEVFHYQFRYNPVYKMFCDLMKRSPQKIKSVFDIPFLPIEIFKTHEVITGNEKTKIIFSSSGITGEIKSRHHVTDTVLYEESFVKCFESFFGDPAEFCFLALLPSYLERNDSSLVYMVKGLMEKSRHPFSVFFLNNHRQLAERIKELESARQKTLLIGVSFALLDFAEQFPSALKSTLIMETGGMKGRREEITREQLHTELKIVFHVPTIHSEYGMTELLSQAYSKHDGMFQSPPWMKVLVRDINDPLQWNEPGTSGAISIIDLANLDSCSFVATSDVGRLNDNKEFEVLGRIDYSDVRGCNLMWDS